MNFDSTVDGAHSLTVSTTGTTLFENNVGSLMTLTSLSVSGTGPISFTPTAASGLTALTVNTSAVGGQNYHGAVTLGADLTLTAAANGPVTFGSKIDGNHALTVSTGGLVKFGGDVGVTTPLASVDSTGAGGVTFTKALTVDTSGLQQYTGKLTLGGTTALTSTGSTVTAGSLAGGTFDLTVTADGSTIGTTSGDANTGGNLTFADGADTATFNGTVTATSLTRTGNGLTDLDGTAVTTSSASLGQSYGGPVRLELGATFADLASGPITFHDIVNGIGNGAQALTVLTNGATTFDGTVGAAFAFGSVTVGSPTMNQGTTVFSSGGFAVTTFNNNTAVGTGLQTYYNSVQLTQDTTLTSNFSNGAAAARRHHFQRQGGQRERHHPVRHGGRHERQRDFQQPGGQRASPAQPGDGHNGHGRRGGAVQREPYGSGQRRGGRPAGHGRRAVQRPDGV